MWWLFPLGVLIPLLAWYVPKWVRRITQSREWECDMSAEPTPTPQPGDFVGPICPYCGAWGAGLCTTNTGSDHPSRRRAEVAWFEAKGLSPESTDL